MTDQDLITKYIKEENQKEALKKLEEGYPIQYIIGNVEFYNTLIEVNENVLIPRFETEYLVEKTINYLKYLEINNPDVLEIGTGSGCISIALKKNYNGFIEAFDISKDAIKMAKNNALINNVDINFFVKDINHYSSLKKFDLIISNPPYVPFNSKVDPKTKYEPQNAIYAPEEGLYFYEIILKKIVNNLKDKYLIAFEIGDKQGKSISNIAKKYLKGCFIKVEKDYNNFERYIFISNQKL